MEDQTKELMDKVYKEGLNIYSLLNKFRKTMSYDMPERVIQIVCEEFLKRKPKINHEWPWFVRVLKEKRDEAYVKSQLEKEKEWKGKTNTLLLKNIFAK